MATATATVAVTVTETELHWPPLTLPRPRGEAATVLDALCKRLTSRAINIS